MFLFHTANMYRLLKTSLLITQVVNVLFLFRNAKLYIICEVIAVVVRHLI